jgi:8-oxo-dGTP diphosphatase
VVAEERRTRVAAYARCVDSSGRTLLCRSTKKGWWTLPGGGIHWGEAPEMAAVRELAEETGLSGEIERLVGVYSLVRPDTQAHAVSIVYDARIVGGTLRAEVDGSTDRCAWLGRAEIESLPLDYFVAEALQRP